MAKEKVNKSQAVRDLLASNPDMKVKEVVQTLAEQGIKVSANQVYFIKGAGKEKKKRKARVVKAAKAATASANGKPKSNVDALTMIREVKALAHKAGGYARLKELVDALAE